MTFKSKARRAGWLLVVAAFAFGILSAVRPTPVGAYGLLSSRYIRMSSSEVGATNTIYSVGFTTVTAGQTVGSVLIRFCSNNPIIGDACTAPTGFNTNDGTLSINNITGNITGLSVASASDANNLLLVRTPGAVANGAVTFDLGNGTTNGITNPTTPTNTTFFARIMLFSGNTNALPADITTDDNNASDAGGVALSTANVLNVTAKVQETLTFCVFTGVNCAAGGTEVGLGDSNNVLISTSTVYLNSNPKFDLASNALGGVIVRLKGDTLTSGSFTISAIGDNSGACVADSTATSSEQFGVRVVTYGTGQVAPAAAADDFGCLAGNHKFNTTFTNTTYGQPFVRTTGATDVSTTNFELAAKAASTTEAGVYTSKLQLIATATY